jgi:hypothetical protein
MARVEPATPAMFDDLHPLLVQLNPGLSKDQWRRVLDYRWRNAADGRGYVLIEKEQIVGFLGTLFSRRNIGGKEVRLCNATSWIVKEEFRGQSLLLWTTLLRVKDCTITNLTSTRPVAALMDKVGFKALETTVRLLFPVPVLPRLARSHIPEITADHGALRETLRASDLQIFSDHSGYDCGHMVVRGPDGYCYLVFTKKRRTRFGRDIPYCHVHYISNRDMFLRHLSRIKLYFLKTFGAWFVAVDERLIGNRSAGFSVRYRLTPPRYYKSDVLAADQIDNLYTEMVVWGL